MKDARNLNNHDLADELERAFTGDRDYYLTQPEGLLHAAAKAIRRLENLRVLQRESINILVDRIDQLENEVNAVEWVNGRIEKELFDCRKRT